MYFPLLLTIYNLFLMKKKFLIIGFLLLFGLLNAKVKVIEAPAIECRNNGLYDVSKIELTDTTIRVYIHNTFIHGWWIEYTGDEKIFDSETGKGFAPIGIEGIGYKERLYMPESGDTTVVLVYPRMSKEVTKIDFGREGWLWIYGISLKETSKKADIPKEIDKWLNTNLKDVPRNEPLDFETDNFFAPDKARLRGYIKGYDPRLNFTTGLVYLENIITNEDYPTVVKIHPDGRFEADLLFNHPQWNYLSLNNQTIPFYLEPGQTLVMIIDWDDCLHAQAIRDRSYLASFTQFRGPLAQVNKDICGFNYNVVNYDALVKEVQAVTPDEFILKTKERQEALLAKLDVYAAESEIHPLAKKLINYNSRLYFANQMFTYISYSKRKPQKVVLNKGLEDPINDSFYGFIGELPVNDRAIIACLEYSSFVNRVRFCKPMRRGINKKRFIMPQPDMRFNTYLFQNRTDISEDEKQHINSAFLISDSTNILTQEACSKIITETTQKYPEAFHLYKKAYIDPLQYQTSINRFKHYRQREDSVMNNHLGIGHSLTAEIIHAQSEDFSLKQLDATSAALYVSYFKTLFKEPFILSEVDRIYNKSFPDIEISAYDLPKGEATDIFNKIIAPYKGKVLFVDFWATSCGPCVGGIKRMKEMREKYGDDPNFEFVFITDERGSPEGRYNEFVEEQDLKNSYRIPKDEYNYLRQLFKFNGIPHYALIDADGKVLNGDYHLSKFSFEREIKKLKLVQ